MIISDLAMLDVLNEQESSLTLGGFFYKKFDYKMKKDYFKPKEEEEETPTKEEENGDESKGYKGYKDYKSKYSWYCKW